MNCTHQDGWRKRILLFLLSQCITLFGSTLVQMAVIWYVTMQTASGIWVAIFSVAAYLPQFLISFVGGVWADRYHRKRLIIGADAGIAIVTLGMVWLIPKIGHHQTLGLLLMSILRSLGAGIQTPAVSAVIPQLVPTEQRMRYNGINAAMQSVVQFAAPAAAGVFFAVGTLQDVLMVDVLTAVIGIGIFCGIPVPKTISAVQERSVQTDIKCGMHYVYSHRQIGQLLLLYGAFTFLCVPAGFLAGLLVRRDFGDTYWYLTGVELIGFAGMLVGGLLTSLWANLQNHAKTLVFGLFAFGAFAISMGLSQNFFLYLTFMLFYGVALTMVQTTLTTLLQEDTRTEMQGRVFGMQSAMYSGCLPIGMAVWGTLADMVSLRWLMIICGILLMILSYWSRRILGECGG